MPLLQLQHISLRPGFTRATMHALEDLFDVQHTAHTPLISFSHARRFLSLTAGEALSESADREIQRSVLSGEAQKYVLK